MRVELSFWLSCASTGFGRSLENSSYLLLAPRGSGGSTELSQCASCFFVPNRADILNALEQILIVPSSGSYSESQAKCARTPNFDLRERFADPILSDKGIKVAMDFIQAQCSKPTVAAVSPPGLFPTTSATTRFPTTQRDASLVPGALATEKVAPTTLVTTDLSPEDVQNKINAGNNNSTITTTGACGGVATLLAGGAYYAYQKRKPRGTEVEADEEYGLGRLPMTDLRSAETGGTTSSDEDGSPSEVTNVVLDIF